MKKTKANKLALLVALLVLAGGQKMFADLTETISSLLVPFGGRDLFENWADWVPPVLSPIATVYSPYYVNFNGRDLVGKLYQDDTMRSTTSSLGIFTAAGIPMCLKYGMGKTRA